jgi:predicted RNA polymerase sigma factor
MRPALCEEALRIGRILAELAPGESEVHGLVSLMEIQASRLHARIGANGEPVLLMEQNRALWDRLLIHRGLLALARGERLGEQRGTYLLQAAIAACHAHAATPTDTDWVNITALYDELAPDRLARGGLNRAVARLAYGPAAELALRSRWWRVARLRAITCCRACARICWQARALRGGAGGSARAQLTQNMREQELLRSRAAMPAWAFLIRRP